MKRVITINIKKNFLKSQEVKHLKITVNSSTVKVNTAKLNIIKSSEYRLQYMDPSSNNLIAV